MPEDVLIARRLMLFDDEDIERITPPIYVGAWPRATLRYTLEGTAPHTSVTFRVEGTHDRENAHAWQPVSPTSGGGAHDDKGEYTYEYAMTAPFFRVLMIVSGTAGPTDLRGVIVTIEATIHDGQ